MIVGFFCIIVVCQCQSTWYVAWCSLCVWMVMILNPTRDSVRAWKVGDHNYRNEQCLIDKWWCHFLCSEGNHASGLQSQDRMLWCSPYNAPTIKSLSKFKTTLICRCPNINTIFRSGGPSIWISQCPQSGSRNITMSSCTADEALWQSSWWRKLGC